jgi:hypothetical protein
MWLPAASCRGKSDLTARKCRWGQIFTLHMECGVKSYSCNMQRRVKGKNFW